MARYVRESYCNAAEFAIVIADAWHGRGIGSRLLAKLIDAAPPPRGVKGLYGDILAMNRPMLTLATKLGFKLSRHEDATLTRACLQLE